MFWNQMFWNQYLRIKSTIPSLQMISNTSSGGRVSDSSLNFCNDMTVWCMYVWYIYDVWLYVLCMYLWCMIVSFTCVTWSTNKCWIKLTIWLKPGPVGMKINDYMAWFMIRRLVGCCSLLREKREKRERREREEIQACIKGKRKENTSMAPSQHSPPFSFCFQFFQFPSLVSLVTDWYLCLILILDTYVWYLCLILDTSLFIPHSSPSIIIFTEP